MLRLVPPLLALLATDPPSAVREGAHFKVVCHFEAGALAVQALEAAEAAWPFAVELYGADPAPLEEPLELHLYRDPGGYRAAEARITGGYFAKNLAFAHHATRAAHVAVQPGLNAALLERVGLPEQTLRLIAHEAAHLARFETCDNFRRHPSWFVDGGASWIDQEAMEALRKSASVESDPWTSQELRSLQGLLATGRLPGARAIFRDQLGRVAFYDRYSIRHGFFRFLREGEERARLAAIQRVVQGTPTGLRYLERVDAAVDGVYGERGYRALDEAFHDWIRAAAPEWDQVRRSLAVRGDEWVQLAFDDHDAQAWRTGRVGRERYALRVDLELLPSAVREAHLLFARGTAGSLRLVVHASGGMRLERVSDVTDVLATSALAAESADGPLALEVRVDGPRVSVRLDGEERFALNVHDLRVDLEGGYGVGVRARSAAVWRGLTLD